MIPPLLDELLRAIGPSGFEEEVAAIVRREASAFAEVSGDVLGSTTAIVRGTEGGRLLAIFAHCDEIGAMVSYVDEDGLLSLQRLGDSTAAASLVGQRIEVRGRRGRVPGVVGSRVKKGKPGWSDLYADIGTESHEESLALVAHGDPLVVVGPPVELAGGRIASKSCDNRVSVWAGLEALRALAASPPAWDVASSRRCRRREPTPARRRRRLRLGPDAALVLDATWATDTPEADPARVRASPARRRHGLLRGPSVHPALADLLVREAGRLGDPHTVEVAAVSLTEADVVYMTGGGVPTCVASIPVRRAHSPAETVQLSDIEACTRLVESFARALGPGLDLTR